jgi:multiple sugar transport system substrate-binding protein
MDTFDRDKKVGSRVDRRTFLKVGGAVGVVAAAGGLEGILAAHRAPAYAQGTKLHWVRWVDFIPEADVELKRQMPEASKALGAEVTLETINANDLQPRITAAIQSGSGADIFMFQYNWAQLYANSVVDVSDVANEIAKAEGGFYKVLEIVNREGQETSHSFGPFAFPSGGVTWIRGESASCGVVVESAWVGAFLRIRLA